MDLFDTMPPASKTLRVLARLLSYPDADMRAQLSGMATAIIGERALAPARQAELLALMDALELMPELEAEAAYVALFDHGRATSLHMFEHVHGDSRDRGPAMIDLAQTYDKAGLILTPGELPDYLPVILEFASTHPPREARAFLAEMAHILCAIHAALRKRESGYAIVIAALLDLAGEDVQPMKLAAEEEIDASWSEPVVFDGCASLGQAKPEQPIQIVRKTSPSEGAQA